MRTEYRIEKQTGDARAWVLADRDADGYTSAEAAENRLKFLRENTFRDRTQLRVASREIGDWTPVPSQLERAIEHVEQVVASRNTWVLGNLMFDDLKLVLEAAKAARQ